MSEVLETPAEHEVLTTWLTANVPGTRAPFALELIAGGRSNLTYLVTDGAGRRMVLRRPPLGHVLQSAHDMGREHRIIQALTPTAVPVPPALGLCEDVTVLGAPFYVMDFVDGVILRDEAAVAAAFPEDRRGAVSDALVDCLADLHALDPDAVGLGELGRKDDYVGRQLRRWKRQFDAARTREVHAIEEAHRRLAAAVPPQRRTGIVHGDYRLDNCMVAADGAIAAVLDWELCTLGDPLADLGLLLVYWARPGDDGPELLTGLSTSMPGFRERSEVVDRYVAATGADVSDVDYFVALGYWKLACIFEGIYARYAAGVMGDDGASADLYADQAVELGKAALAVTERL